MQHKEKIFELHQEGKSYREIQKLLNCSKGTIAYHLGKGQKEASKERLVDLRARNRKYVRDYKESVPCADCNVHYPYWVMDFDHIKGKSFNISETNRVTENLDIIKEEIEKCEVVCANCHRTRTQNRLQASAPTLESRA